MIPDNALSTVPVIGELRIPAKTGSATSARHDWELAGAALNDPSQGLRVKVWHFVLDQASGTVYAEADGVPLTALFTAPGTTEIAGCFDQNMNPFIAYRQAGAPKLWWYDPLAASMAHMLLPADCLDVRCTMDEKRSFNIANSDIILAYLRNGGLCVRYQRDRYEVEHVLQEDVGSARLVSLAMDAGLRLQFKFSGVLPEPPPPATSTRWRLQIDATRTTDAFFATVAELELRVGLAGADQASGGTATAGSTYGAPNEAAAAFDNNLSTSWSSLGDSRTSDWLAYETAVPISVVQIAITAAAGSPARAARAPRSFRLQHSSDGAAWETVLTVVDQPAWAENETRLFNIP